MKWEDPVYIKMSKKAPEIQELWKPTIGDWFYKEDGIGYGLWLVCKVEHGSLWCSGERMGEFPFSGKLVQFMVPENYIWLPRQDQLQEMMSDYIQEQLGVIHSEIKQAFLDFAHWLDVQYLPESFTCVPTNCFETGGQLWLAFVMKEKYNKTWDGENWIKEKK